MLGGWGEPGGRWRVGGGRQWVSVGHCWVGGGQGLASVLFKRKSCSRVLMRSFQKN